jgi:hypothetical protein
MLDHLTYEFTSSDSHVSSYVGHISISEWEEGRARLVTATQFACTERQVFWVSDGQVRPDHQIWRPATFLVELVKSVVHGCIWHVSNLNGSQTMYHCSWWKSDSGDTEACMGWNQLTARHESRHKRTANGHLLTESFSLELHPVFFSVYIYSTGIIRPPSSLE